jgi:hypothetical protein
MGRQRLGLEAKDVVDERLGGELVALEADPRAAGPVEQDDVDRVV